MNALITKLRQMQFSGKGRHRVQSPAGLGSIDISLIYLAVTMTRTKMPMVASCHAQMLSAMQQIGALSAELYVNVYPYVLKHTNNPMNSKTASNGKEDNRVGKAPLPAHMMPVNG
jgi:hypothetical protein